MAAIKGPGAGAEALSLSISRLGIEQSYGRAVFATRHMYVCFRPASQPEASQQDEEVEALREDVVSPLHRAPSCCPVGLCQAPDEQEPGQGGHGLGHRGFPPLPPETQVRRECFPTRFIPSLFFLCVLITARDDEELGIHNHKGFGLSFWTDIFPSHLSIPCCHFPLFSFPQPFSSPKSCP